MPGLVAPSLSSVPDWGRGAGDTRSFPACSAGGKIFLNVSSFQHLRTEYLLSLNLVIWSVTWMTPISSPSRPQYLDTSSVSIPGLKLPTLKEPLLHTETVSYSLGD